MNRNPGLPVSVLAFAILLFFATHAPAIAQTSPHPKPAAKPDHSLSSSLAVNAMFSTTQFKQASVSPDGKKVAWVETIVGASERPAGNSAIFVADLRSGRSVEHISADAKAAHDEEGIVWSPDSRQIAFLSDAAKPGQLELYVQSIPPTTTVPRKLTSVKGFLATPRWSPEGGTIAVLLTENATRAAGPLVAETPQTGEIKEAVSEQRLALVDVATGNLRILSPADMYVYEYDWSPDGKRFAVTSAFGNGDDNWYIAQLYTLDIANGLMHSIYQPPLQIANPAWSPDGKNMAFIAGLMSDEPSVGGDIITVNDLGGNLRNLTPERKASASWLTWTPEGKILFGEYVGGDAAISLLDPSSGNIEALSRSSEQLTAGLWGTNLSVSHDAKTSAVIRSSFSQPPEVWAGALGAWKQISARNTGVKSQWGQAQSIQWKSEGFDVQGWLLYPANFDPGKKYPLIVRVHGGPGSAVLSHWPVVPDYAMALAGAGYFVLQPNPRGSFGQGEAFTQANVKDFGYGDFRDILAGVDEAIRVAPIDPERLGLCGWSYGGFMTMWGVTQTNRFKAAMAGAGLSNWQSYYGENLIDQWMIPFFGASVYDDPSVYAKSSPINFVKNVKTPTLIQVGDSDGECPAPQSYEFWHALRTLGVETQLVVYEHEGHAFSNPKHQRELIERTLAWFDAHLK